MAITLAPLPPFPSTRARASLSPSQAATLLQTISAALAQVLSFPDAQITSSANINFVASYAKDAAQQALHALVWDSDATSDHTPKLSQTERKVRHNVFLLAERLAPLGALDLQTLVDLSVAYARVSHSRLRALSTAAFVQSSKASELIEQVQKSAVPAFTALLSSPTQGLYGLRKTAHILLCCLHPAPQDVTRAFARNKTFMRALATAYDSGLASFAQTYGGFRAISSLLADGGTTRELDEWERLFLETKVALLDTFHILVRTLLDDVASVAHAGPALAAQAEPAFEVVFDLLDLPAATGSVSGATGLPPTPFLNRPLLADYQHAYDFSRTLADVLRRTEDARADLLESSLHAMTLDATGSRAGALKLILHSSGVPPGIDNLGRGPAGKTAYNDVKGKGVDVGERLGSGPGESTSLVPSGVPDEQLDIALVQVLDLFPDQDPAYIRYLLSHSEYPYKGDAERLIGALLEGTAPSKADVDQALARERSQPPPPAQTKQTKQADEFAFTRGRRNVFDDEAMDLSKVKIGKKSEDAQVVLQDRSFIEQMKEDILRRAEEISDSEDEEEDGGKGKGRDLAYEDELEDADVVKVRDGDPSDLEGDEEEVDGEVDGTETPRTPETVLEQAYIRDPKLFDRDGQTRRSKARADLKAQTGMTDEQIEGWRIMLERDPKKKERMLAKYEFTGNKPLPPPMEAGSSGSRGGGGGQRGRGGGRGRGGRGRRGGRGGGGGGGDGGEGGSARDRAWKDKNKASRANHNRKRGHDKKMARAGGPS
ncbi:hypothetical protein GY45DRAFT_1106095 [Cubamyces sp. BRFM 1775]|nr:hypothetical protein GY45DRAFT_1106095 [Cubamyces sp. BRFM 1775]